MDTLSKRRWSLKTDLVALAVLLAAALAADFYDHAMFHFVLEVFRIVVGFMAFTIAWNARHYIEDRFLLLYCMVLGPAAAVTVLHTLSYRDMGIFPRDLAADFWLAENLLMAAGAAAASFLAGRRVRAHLVLAIAAASAVALVTAIFLGVFPEALSVDGSMRPFRIAAGVAITLAFGVALMRYAKDQHVDPAVRLFVILSLLFMIGQEAVLAPFGGDDLTGLPNRVGHYLIFGSAYMLFAGVVRVGISAPHEAIYRKLAHTNARLADEALYNRAMADMALEAASADIWQWDLRSGRVDLSPRFSEALGYRHRDLPLDMEGLVALLVHPEDVPTLVAAVSAMRAGSSDRLDVEVRVRDKGGNSRWVMCRGRSVKVDGCGRPEFVVGIHLDVTAQKTRERDLRASEERFRAIFNSVDDFIFIHDAATGAILDCNDRACELYGYDRDEMRRMDIQALSAGAINFNNAEAMALMMAAVEGEPQQLEWKARSRSGRAFWAEIRIRAAVIGGRRLLLLTGRDVTERRAASEALEWDARVSGVFAEIGKRILLPRGDEDVGDQITEAAKDLTGSRVVVVAPYSDDLGAAITRQLGCNELPARCPMVRDVLVFGRVGMRNGSSCAYGIGGGCGRYIIAPAMAGGRMLGVVGVAGAGQDYTTSHFSIVGRLADHYAIFLQRLEAEASLRDSEARFRSMAQAANDAVVVVDQAGRVAFWNPAAERLFQYAEDEMVGQELHRMVMPDPDDPVHHSAFKAFSRTGRGAVLNRTIELTARRKDGHLFPVELSVSPFRYAQGWHAVGIVRDISDRKEMQQQLTQLQKMEALGNLAGGIAHDFNNMILPITMFTEMAIEDLPPDSPTVGMLRKVLGASERAKELVMRILAFSRKAESERVRGPLLPAVQDALELVRATLAASIELRPDLEDVGEASFDRSQIQTILLNMVSNSADAIDGGTGWIAVGLHRVKATEAMAAGILNLVVGRSYAQLRVKDSGCGMAPEVIERIFDPFFTTKPVGHGTGLGMPMVHSVVRNHGGAIRVHSQVGKGTTIEIYLPLEL